MGNYENKPCAFVGSKTFMDSGAISSNPIDLDDLKAKLGRYVKLAITKHRSREGEHNIRIEAGDPKFFKDLHYPHLENGQAPSQPQQTNNQNQQDNNQNQQTQPSEAAPAQNNGNNMGYDNRSAY